jgi:acetyl esterase/lipase
MRQWIAFVVVFLAFAARAGTVMTDVPSDPKADATYVLYLHGRIIEQGGPRPTDPRFGVYDYAGVLDALAQRGAVVVSAQRPPDTDVNAYAGRVVSQVEKLIRAGVAPDHIVVVGFSKGGDIAVHVSSFLRRPEVRYVLLGACWDRSKEAQLRLTGRVLSIYEESDTLAGMSCADFNEKPERPTSFRELKISTGRSHGAFYQPMPEWVKPVLEFVHEPAAVPKKP